MRTIKYLLPIISLLNAIGASAQPTYVSEPSTTPNGAPIYVERLVSGELSQKQKDDYKNYWMNSIFKNKLTFLGEATCKYNCHSYAWAERTDVCMDGLWVPEYWFDSSYAEVLNQSEATKVWYEGGDHSAITTVSYNSFISKWADGPLFQHSKDDCPYTYSSLRYFAPPAISGTNVIGATCSGTFYVSVPSSGVSGEQWQVIGGAGSYLSPTSGSGSTFTVSRTSSQVGPEYVGIQVSFYYNNQYYAATKYFMARIFPQIIMPTSIHVGVPYYFKSYVPTDLDGIIQQFYWDITIDGNNYQPTGNPAHTPVTFSSPGEHIVSLRVFDGCDFSKWTNVSVNVEP
jgi:hypothetical protein